MNKFLKTKTLVREDILNQKLIYELKEASALREIHLKTFRSDVDIDGFDIIFDNNEDWTLKCQIKSKFQATTNCFDIHKIMLKPNLYNINDLGFFEPIGCPPDNRAVILIEAAIENKKLETKYFYLDVYILRAIELGVFKLKAQSKKKSKELLKELRYGKKKSNEKIKVLQSLFIPVKDAQALLGIMGFHSDYNVNLQFKIRQISKIANPISENKYKNSRERIDDMRGYWESANEDLKNLSSYQIKDLPLEDSFFDKES